MTATHIRCRYSDRFIKDVMHELKSTGSRYSDCFINNIWAQGTQVDVIVITLLCVGCAQVYNGFLSKDAWAIRIITLLEI